MKSLPVVALTVALASSLSAVMPTAAAQMYKGVDLYALQMPTGNFYLGPVDGPNQYTARGGQVVGYIVANPIRIGGLLWTEPDGALVDFTLPGFFDNSSINGTDGVRQVGSRDVSNRGHASLWTGTPNSFVDLHPTNLMGFVGSSAHGLSGDQQVGAGGGGATNDNEHALLWNNSADSAVDLHPTNLVGFDSSVALATDGVRQTGYLYNHLGTVRHATLWNGTADSAVDLNPAGVDFSVAYAVGGAQQVGSGIGVATNNQEHALLWTGTADSVVDLHPTNLGDFSSSLALGANGSVQVGYALEVSRGYTPIVWNGSADSAIDLTQFLPQDFLAGQAFSVDQQGVIYGIASGGVGASRGLHAVMWIPIPEPATALPALIALLAAASTRHYARVKLG